MKASDCDRLQEDFLRVSNTVGETLASQNPHIVAIAAKWDAVDLVPGLSDLDYRIICDDLATAEDWVQIDRVCGENHLQMVREHPEWNRINEHTPGAGITVSELFDRRFHNPEYQTWTTWWGADDWLADLKSDMEARKFGANDEHVHLATFLRYFSPYVLGIDPPINLGHFKEKYPLHSRCWHYFAPPMLSAACLLARRNLSGKRAALTWLRQNGHVGTQVDAVLEQVDAHYESLELTNPRKLEELETHLFAGFNEVWPRLLESVECLEFDRTASPNAIKQDLEARVTEPFELLMESVRFARIRAGRYYFYLNAPKQFQADELLRRELTWIRKLTAPVFAALGSVVGDAGLRPMVCLDRLDIVPDSGEQNALEHVLNMARCGVDDPTLPRLFHQAIERFPNYYRLLDRAMDAALAKAN
ncbi:MAG: hypothetical protein WD468_12470 [Pirellulales bacterium]